jgi:hypothetical protein
MTSIDSLKDNLKMPIELMSNGGDLDVEDLIQKSLMAGEGIASLKNTIKGPKMKSVLTHKSNQNDLPLDISGIGELASFFNEKTNFDLKEIKKQLKRTTGVQIKAHLIRIQDELKGLENCLEQMNYKYLAMKASYAGQDLKQISDALSKKEE